MKAPKSREWIQMPAGMSRWQQRALIWLHAMSVRAVETNLSDVCGSRCSQVYGSPALSSGSPAPCLPRLRSCCLQRRKQQQQHATATVSKGAQHCPHQTPHPLMMTSAPASKNNKGQQSRREGAAERRGWTGGMTRRSGGRGVGRQGRRTQKDQGAEGVVVCPGAVGVLPGGQCVRQRLGSLVSDVVVCSAKSSSSNMQQPQ